jgi:hypothetical protein
MVRRLLKEIVCEYVVPMSDPMIRMLLALEIKFRVDEVKAIRIEEFHDGRFS